MNIMSISHRFFEFIKNICFPMICYGCDEHVDSIGLCNNCWKKIKWISDPKCKICGKPFEIDVNSVCLSCLKKKPYFDRAIHVFEYSDSSKGIILRFKHGDSTFLGEQLAQWMYRSCESDIKNADIIIPVPIHFWKRLKRKYNQAEILAIGLSKLSKINYEPRVLVKSKRTMSQEGLSKENRRTNIKGSFSINEKYAQNIDGKTIVLVDDVFTTGSTANECAKVMKKAGAKSVIVVTLAIVN